MAQHWLCLKAQDTKGIIAAFQEHLWFTELSAFCELLPHLNVHYHNAAALGMFSALTLGSVLPSAALPWDKDQCLPAEGIPNYKE